MLQAIKVSMCCRTSLCQYHVGSMCQCCRLKQCHMLQVIKVSVFCRLSQCQCVASSNSVSVLYALTFVSVLQALTVSVCCTH